MEALTDDIVFSLSAFLRPHDLLHLALTSRRFGGSPGGAKNGARVLGAEAEERVAKRQRLDANRAEKSDGFAEGVGRNVPLMDEVARRLVEGRRNFSSELLQRRGGESWMAVLHRLERQHQLIEEAVAAAPAIFAKPGDKFRLWDCDYHTSGKPKVRYVGRSERLRGRLVFHHFGQYEDISRSLDLLGPDELYRDRTPSGETIDQSLCLSPEDCGAFISLGRHVDERIIKDRVKKLCITHEMLAEAKEAAPALVAKPGDLFEWNQNRYGGSVILKFIGRNQVPSTVKIVYDTSGRSFGYSTPKVGWLVFRDDGHKNGVLRDGIGAWPDYKYSHYDAEGQRIKGTLCIPPEKCGALKTRLSI